MEFEICHCVIEDPESAHNNSGERAKIKKTALKRQSIRSDCDRSRTYNRWSRNPVLYPIELRSH